MLLLDFPSMWILAADFFSHAPSSYAHFLAVLNGFVLLNVCIVYGRFSTILCTLFYCQSMLIVS
jgi:hypothetical protein